jgi:hypothetical protein
MSRAASPRKIFISVSPTNRVDAEFPQRFARSARWVKTAWGVRPGLSIPKYNLQRLTAGSESLTPHANPLPRNTIISRYGCWISWSARNSGSHTRRSLPERTTSLRAAYRWGRISVCRLSCIVAEHDSTNWSRQRSRSDPHRKKPGVRAVSAIGSRTRNPQG